jgi:hypothetical protein
VVAAVEGAEAPDVNPLGFGDINIYGPAANPSQYRQAHPATLDEPILVNPTPPRGLRRAVDGQHRLFHGERRHVDPGR